MVFAEKPLNKSEFPETTPEFHIRRMRPTDLQDFVALGLPTCAFMHGRPDVSPEKMQQNFSGFVREHAFSDESQIFVANDSTGRHAGQLWLHATKNRFNCRRELWIWDITVHPDFRSKGLGKQLFEFAKAQARSRRIEELWLLVSSINYVAIQLYRSSGLRSLGQLMCLPVAGEVRPQRTVEFGATVLRPLASNDVDALYDLWTQAGLPFRPEGRDSRSRLGAFLNGHDDPGWCASAEDHLIAAAVIADDGRKGWIERLAVRPEHRRAGLARAVVTACMNSLRERGILVIGAMIDRDNAASRALFESCGFTYRPDFCYYSHRQNKND